MFNLINPKLDKENKEYITYYSLLKNLLKKKGEKEAEVNITIKILEQEFKEYIDQISTLEQEIIRIRQNKNIEFNNENNEETIFEENVNSAPPEDKAKDLNIKSLFRLISKKTHPDKTDNLELHELFVLANDAYNKNNYSIILDIYNKIYNEQDFNLNITIKDKLNLIKEQFNREKETFDNFTKSNTYVINELYKSDKIINNFRAKQLFSEILFARMVELEKIKESIK
jgi:hypothetical protein